MSSCGVTCQNCVSYAFFNLKFYSVMLQWYIYIYIYNNKNAFLIRRNVTCKSSFVTYLMEWMLPLRKITICWKTKYSLNLRVNTHRNDIWRRDGPPWDKHFQMPGHNFNAHAKFSIIEEVYNKSLSKLKIRSLLEHREDFWILKMQTLYPRVLNISLNYPQDTTESIW